MSFLTAGEDEVRAWPVHRGVSAQKAAGGGYKAGLHAAWFAGYLQLPDPRHVIVVCVDEPKATYWATDVAAPAFGRIAARLVTLLGVPPNKVQHT